MKIVLTNDDGIDAPGLQALCRSVTEALADYSPEIIVVAPDRGRSECGHSVTQTRPLTLRSVKPNWYSVDGTPVDCVRVALNALMPETDLVFSGINQGANLGVNLTVSGTFAAAREAAMIGLPAMAVSHYRHPDYPKSWDHCSRWLRETLQQFAAQTVSARDNCQTPESATSGSLWNVNLPAIDPNAAPSIHECEIDQCPIPRTVKRDGSLVSFELDFHGRPRQPGRDVAACFAGNMTISKLSPFLV
ncbi:5'/3'-nucleotidase SurE [Planctomycetes bacterium K23_9]|uniref:5'-nucleotidase n=1 Tax=Stieleria marina TaxID=1930275 RepID=A0A517NS63_9BACT|nr:5'-nucleotidase SurE [Planctomycetes bacterium K23_9]